MERMIYVGCVVIIAFFFEGVTSLNNEFPWTPFLDAHYLIVYWTS